MKRYDLEGAPCDDCWMQETADGEYLNRQDVIQALYKCGLEIIPLQILTALGITLDEWSEKLKDDFAELLLDKMKEEGK